MNQRPFWQLPAGVSRGTWDYVQSNEIADHYDEFIADHRFVDLDLAMLRNLLPKLGSGATPLVADLGCGTGRIAAELAPQGYRVLSVDLSKAMLQRVSVRLRDIPLAERSGCLRANLAELGCLRDGTIDVAVCLFSTIGMIRGRGHRLQFLKHVLRALKPGGVFLLHAHNRYYRPFDPGSLRWLTKSRIQSLLSQDCDFGDRVYSYRGLPSMFLHIFSRREIRQDLWTAGFRSIQIQPIRGDASGLLKQRGSLNLSDLRAGGFYAIARSE